MIVTREMLNSEEFAPLFLHCKNPKAAKEEILKLFGKEPGDGFAYSEQDIYEQRERLFANTSNTNARPVRFRMGFQT